MKLASALLYWSHTYIRCVLAIHNLLTRPWSKLTWVGICVLQLEAPGGVYAIAMQ